MHGSLDILKSSELLRSMPDALLEELCASSEVHRWPAGEVIRAEQSEDDDIFLLINGEVRSDVLLCNADQKIGYTIDTAGNFLGLYHFIEPGRHPLTMTAETDVEAIVWHADLFRRTIESDPAAAYKTAVYTARHLYRQALHLSTYLLDNICWGLP